MNVYRAPAHRRLLDAVFALVEAAAVAGERCPQNWQLPKGAALLPKLARMGRVRIEVFGHNWRVVTIMEGPHKGKTTARSPNPFAKQPYKIIDKEPETLTRHN